MPTNLFNIDPTVSTDPAILIAHDAIEAGHPGAMQLLVGLPATISIGSDHYGCKVVAVTAKTITIEKADKWGSTPKHTVFRCTKFGWTYRKHHRLHIGEAVTAWDPCF